ncbi:Hypothetical predicted protein [Cloeon dipterum]|uniref:PHD-type domain-containing protein n=1 Tax=Cloeon dipterum TaxID=197152 RepID=A0A8S1CUQ7_9INSE|nr:Hypothetical predicted protein [Cloeon dipterum]
MKSKITRRTAVLFTTLCAVRMQLLIFDLRTVPLLQPTPPHRWTPEFTTSAVNTRCVLPLWTTLDAGRTQAHKKSWLRSRLLLAPGSLKVSPVKRALWHLSLRLALSGQVELSPGPLVNCVLCDRPGRRTQIRIKCEERGKNYHATCLKMSTGEKAKFRLGGYKCMVCALPSISDSLWSLPAAMNFPVLHTTSNRPKKEATILCFNARSLKNRKRAADIVALLEVHSADVVAINETWLSADVLDHEVIPTDLVVLRKDRVGGKRPAGAQRAEG